MYLRFQCKQPELWYSVELTSNFYHNKYNLEDLCLTEILSLVYESYKSRKRTKDSIVSVLRIFLKYISWPKFTWRWVSWQHTWLILLYIWLSSDNCLLALVLEPGFCLLLVIHWSVVTHPGNKQMDNRKLAKSVFVCAGMCVAKVVVVCMCVHQCFSVYISIYLSLTIFANVSLSYIQLEDK